MVREGGREGGGFCERGVWGRAMGLEGWWSLAVVECVYGSTLFGASYPSIQTLLLW